MAKPIIVSRATKGSALTFVEGDANFSNLQNATLTVAGDSGTSQAIDLNDTLTVSGGVGLTASMTTKTVTLDLDNTAVTPGSYTASNITVDAQGRVTAASNGSAGGNAFSFVSVAGQSQVEADSASDTLNLAAGSGITITTDANTDTVTIAASGGSGLANIVEDTTPQLGGQLDVNGQSIVSVSNGNINLAPNGTGNISLTPASGKIVLGALDFPTGTGTNGQVLTTNGSNQLSFTTPSGGGGETYAIYRVTNMNGTIISGTTYRASLAQEYATAGWTYTLSSNAIQSVPTGTYYLEAMGSGNGSVANTTFRWTGQSSGLIEYLWKTVAYRNSADSGSIFRFDGSAAYFYNNTYGTENWDFRLFGNTNGDISEDYYYYIKITKLS